MAAPAGVAASSAARLVARRRAGMDMGRFLFAET